MIKNYFKIAWRNLWKNKVYSSINILGLAFGMAVVMLIAFWIWDEITYNKSFDNHKELARVMTTMTGDDGELRTNDAVPMPIGQELRDKYGNDFKNVSMASWNLTHVLGVDTKNISTKGMWVESNFPSMFSLKMKFGDRNALTDPSAILINASVAKTFFGNEDPINKMIRFDNKDSYKVGGVFEDFPDNTTFNTVTMLVPWAKYITTGKRLQQAQTEWNQHSWQCFVQLANNINTQKETDKIKDVVMSHKNAKTDGVEQAYLFSMDQWRLYSEFKNGKPVGGRIQFVWLFSVIGIFVLLLACINFMNLSTARSEKRAKEVGIRKTVGSLRSQLISQFLSESVLMAFISFLLAIAATVLLLPLFNSLADKHIQIPWKSAYFWLTALAFICVTGLISGSYPAFYLSKFEPIKVLKGTFRAGKFASFPRKALVVVQFTFSIALIIGTVIVYKQIQFVKDRPVNYRTDGLITVPMIGKDLHGHYEAIRSELLGTDVVDNMAESSSPTTALTAYQIGFNWQGKDPNTLPVFGTIAVTESFGKTIGWHLREGRDFSKEFATDSSALILNEAAAQLIGVKDLIGLTVQFEDKNYTVIGVVKDMIMESPYQPVKPTVFFYNPSWVSDITIAIKKDADIKNALSKIEAVFKKFSPASPFSFRFNDEDYARKFADEERIGNLSSFFTILAIFISCLGLFGLASFVAEQRRKEIGVRKVLGASVYDLWRLLSKEFALLIIISALIAIPLSWYYSAKWLTKFDYRTSITVWIFLISGLAALMITLLTVSFQTIKAALANPVKSLRSE